MLPIFYFYQNVDCLYSNIKHVFRNSFVIKEIVLLQILQESLPVAAPLHPHLFKGNMVTTGLFHDDLYFSQMKRRFTIQILGYQLFGGK